MTQSSREYRYAMLLELIKRLRAAGSWCGETHVQKSAFVLEAVSTDSLDYDFIMYKHGPFSFDLRDDIAGMRAARLVELEVPQEGYGPKLRPSDISEKVVSKYERHIKAADKAITFVVSLLGKKDVKDLEKLSTAIYVLKGSSTKSAVERAEEIKRLKPHISLADAERAIQAADSKLEEARLKRIN